MEHKRMSIMFIAMMIVMVMGNFVVQTEAQASSFGTCFPGCILKCAVEKQFPNALMCPLTCIMTCLAPPSSSPPSQMILANKIDHLDYFCKLGCATHHCASISSLQKPDVNKIVDCVDSCLDTCSNKN